MDDIRLEKLRRVVFERLTLGANRDTLRETLGAKLDAEAAEEMLDEAVREIARRRAAGGYATFARALRKREFERPYFRYKVIAGFLGFWGVLAMVVSVASGKPLYIPFIPLTVALIIMIALEKTVREKMEAASLAVERLLEPSP